jgi:hypothetical protein
MRTAQPQTRGISSQSKRCSISAMSIWMTPYPEIKTRGPWNICVITTPLYISKSYKHCLHCRTYFIHRVLTGIMTQLRKKWPKTIISRKACTNFQDNVNATYMKVIASWYATVTFQVNTWYWKSLKNSHAKRDTYNAPFFLLWFEPS